MSDIVLSSGQAVAHDMMGSFLKQDDDLFARITGYAGTGKTTLIRKIHETYGVHQVLTPTGKAALRVGEATGLHGMTIHRFLYEPTEDPRTGKPIFKLRELWDDIMTDMKGKLVVVDEASMVDSKVWYDLVMVARRVGFHLLIMGDLFQLPPVYKDEKGSAFSTLTLPCQYSANLTEVHRQALDSPIIRASMMLRSGAPEYEAMETLEALGMSELIPEMIAARERGGAGICFTNAFRRKLNTRMREALGYPEGTLQKGEPVLVTQNNYQLGCWNGEVLEFEGWQRSPDERGSRTVVADRYTTSSMEMRFGVGHIIGQCAVLSPEQFTGKSEDGHIGGWAVKKCAKRWYRDTFYGQEGGAPYLDCNYGYALTCHKAQGSEWPEVIVVIEDRLSSLKGIEKKRWLYTALTRAKDRVRYCYVGE